MAAGGGLLLLGAACSSDGEAEAAPQTTSTRPSTTTTSEPPIDVLEFTATSTTSFGGNAPCGDGGQALEATGAGESPELGTYTMAASHCTLLPSGEIMDGEATYALADGDAIFGTYTGQCDLSDIEAVQCRLDVTVDGGTGRFRAATGSITVASLVDVVAGTGQETLSGTMGGVASAG